MFAKPFYDPEEYWPDELPMLVDVDRKYALPSLGVMKWDDGDLLADMQAAVERIRDMKDLAWRILVPNEMLKINIVSENYIHLATNNINNLWETYCEEDKPEKERPSSVREFVARLKNPHGSLTTGPNQQVQKERRRK